MKIKIYYILIIVIGFFICSCEDNYTDGISPAHKNANNIKGLRDKLTQSKYGWRMIYFPKTDSLLFTNKDEILQKLGDYQKLYGYGGHYFDLKFNKDGVVHMRADYDEKTIEKVKESEFEIKQNTFTELSFTTYNYIHKLVNDRFEGSSDFLYVGEDFKGDLIFKTSSKIHPAQEYVLLQELKSKASYEEGIKTSYANRKFFEKMINPQLTIKKGDRVYFKSDVRVKTDSPLELYQKFLKEIILKRYYLFKFNTLDDVYLSTYKPKHKGLGSGYVGTEKGLFFYSGIRYDSKNIFYNFERKGDKFVCELVKIYDPLRKFMYVSKHLFPKGEPTHMVAEIYDAK